jgi:carbon storage regulator CsrA
VSERRTMYHNQPSTLTNNNRGLHMGLVLTRRPGEVVEITRKSDGLRIEIEVGRIKGNQVALNISAPQDVTIDRAEIAERKRRENEGG